MEQQTHRHGRLIVGIVLAMAVLGIILVALDWREVRRVLGQANWELVIFALLATAVSYACLSLGFAAVCRIFRIPMPHGRLVEIGFVSITVNHLLSTGGMAGLSLRLILMRRHGLETHQILSASLFHSYFNNLALFTLLPAGLVYILLTHPLSPGQYLGVGVALAVLSAVLGLASVVVFIGRTRRAMLRLLGQAWWFTRRRDIQGPLGGFDAAFAEGVEAIRRRPIVLALPVALIIGDWVANVAALWFCFDALGEAVGPGILLTGFVVGVAVGLVSFVPGGLGIQEGSMVGAYALLGVPFEQAVLAAVLFRVVYYFIPFGVSLLLYRRLLRAVKEF